MRGPSTALYRSFLEHCTLNNKTMGTIWQHMSKPRQSRPSPDSCPLWLFVGISSVLGPVLASILVDHIVLWQMSLYIYWLTVCITLYVCVMILCPLRVGLLLVGLYKEDYLEIHLYMSLLWHSFCGSWEGWDPLTSLTTPVWWLSLLRLSILSRLQSKFKWQFCALPFGIFCWWKGFYHMTE